MESLRQDKKEFLRSARRDSFRDAKIFNNLYKVETKIKEKPKSRNTSFYNKLKNLYGDILKSFKQPLKESKSLDVEKKDKNLVSEEDLTNSITEVFGGFTINILNERNKPDFCISNEIIV